MTPGHAAYEAWANVLGFNVTAAPYDRMPRKVKEAWEHAAVAAIQRAIEQRLEEKKRRP